MSSLEGASQPTAAARSPIRLWLWRNRTSPRLAFMLRTLSMALTAILSLIWARLLVQTLGAHVFGVYLTFLAVAQLGGLGDLGISGAVGARMIHSLAKSEDEIGQRFLANARGAFLLISALFLLIFALLSPWLPGWLGFVPAPPGVGSLSALFALGGVTAALIIINGYFQNLNDIHGNMVWPVIPAFICTQAGSIGQCVLAFAGAPLWAQHGAQLLAAFGLMLFGVWMLRISHPWLGWLLPVRFEAREVRALATTSFWVYLATLGNLIYVTTDQIMVNAGFGAEYVPAYRFNYKLCELALRLLIMASYVTLPLIALRLLRPSEIEQANGRSGLERLQQIQAFGACVGAMIYFCVNDAFIGIWVGPEFRMPLALQAAFALNLVVTIAGDVGVQLRGRLDLNGVRLAGIAAGSAGLLNLLLSFVAMKAGSLAGIAAATVVAQSALSLALNRSTCAKLNLPLGEWLFRTWLLPAIAVGISILLRIYFPPNSIGHTVRLALLHIPLLAGLAWALGIRWRLFVDEWQRLRASFS